MKRTRGFTLIELLVVVAIIALLISILVPSLQQAREIASRAACSANLSAVGKALALYHAENNQMFPNLHDQWPLSPPPQNANNQIVAPFTPAANAPFEKAGSTNWDGAMYGKAVQQNYYLLIYRGMLSAPALVCKSTEDMPAQLSANQHGFSAGSEVSYGLMFPTQKIITTDSGTVAMNASWLKPELPSGMAIAADRSALAQWTNGPGTKWYISNSSETPPRNSSNHGLKGQSILFADFHVEFTNERKVGISNNNIYTNDLQSNGSLNNGNRWGQTTNKLDSMIVHSIYPETPP